MKRSKDFLDLLGSFVKAWPILVLILAILISLVLELTNIVKITIQLSIPLPALITAIALILYPILKFIQWLVSKPSKSFRYAGLLWEPSKLSFRYPTPICPRKNCGCVIGCKAVSSISVETNTFPLIQTHDSYRFIFECPIHGVISDVPNEDIAELQKKAKIAQSKLTS
jgi:hypothetical protein